MSPEDSAAFYAPKHTPGPWAWVGGNSLYHVISPGVFGSAVLTASYEWDTGVIIASSEADENLISAAPDLLAALKNFAFPGDYTGKPTQSEIIAQARAAIAKATGA